MGYWGMGISNKRPEAVDRADCTSLQWANMLTNMSQPLMTTMRHVC